MDDPANVLFSLVSSCCLTVAHSPSAISYSPVLSPLPPIPLTGEHLRICPQGYTCCTSDMEDNLATLSRRELEGLLKDDGRSLQTSLTGQYKAFDGRVNQ